MHASWKNRESTRQIGNLLSLISTRLTNPQRWMFEKYDGIRGFWNPLKKAFYSRKGRQFTFPQEIIDDMPTDVFLDGELWYHPPNLTILCLSLFLTGKGLAEAAIRKQ